MNQYMDMAIELSKKAMKNNEVPVGAVMVYENKIIAKSYNKRHNFNNVLGHAEVLVVLKSQKKLKSWHLNGCELYVTLKPCDMCMSILKESRISKVYFLIDKPAQKRSFGNTIIEKLSDYDFKSSNLYLEMLSTFFKNKR